MSEAHVQLPRPVLRSRHGVVACSSPAAASAAAAILGGGGSAVDAMIAAASVLAVVQPQACGLGGDAMILVHSPGGVLAINGNGQAPGTLANRIPPDGGGTVAVPGFVAGLLVAHDRFGRLPRSRLFERAIELADGGFAVGEELAKALHVHDSRLRRTSAAWPLCDDAITAASIVRLPRLAEVLGRIAGEGRDAFYSGESGRAIADAVHADGGAMTLSDLDGYSAIVREPVRGVFRGATVEVSPPTSQGLLLLVALKKLEQGDQRQSARFCLQEQVEAIQTAFRFRSLVASDDAEALLLAGDPSTDPVLAGTCGRPLGYNHTAAIAVADRNGQTVSALVSVFDEFGSATFVPELEIHLNSRLLGFDDGPNAPSPGRRPVHTLAPTIVTTPERVIAIATPGADGQIQTLLQVLVRVLHNEQPLNEALDAPRWRVVGDELVVEEGFPPANTAELDGQVNGVRVAPAGDQLFGAVSATVALLRGGALEAVSDPRRESWAAVS